MWRWDIFCKVVDNYGDIGTCWRLAQQLAEEHDADVRLWVNQLQSFAQICPTVSTNADQQRVGRVEIRHWRSDECGRHTECACYFPDVEPADVVIEAFACELPEGYIAAMARKTTPPVWINLEYLSAEAWVEGCHRLPSPRTNGPLTKYFFFPGFTPATGGLLRKRDLLADRAAFDSAAEADFWRSLGVPARSDRELRVSLFCYQNPALPDLLQCWADGPDAVTVLATPGPATDQVATWFGEPFCWPGSVKGDSPIFADTKIGTVPLPGKPLLDSDVGNGPDSTAFLAAERFIGNLGHNRRASLTAYALPFLPQSSFDRLLWASDVNFVRGEDSLVRALWAARPFVWQIYPQADEAHLVKLEAFLSRYLHNFEKSDVVRGCWHAWNGGGGIASIWPDFVANRPAIEQQSKVWASTLDQTGDLANNLACFVRGICLFRSSE